MMHNIVKAKTKPFPTPDYWYKLEDNADNTTVSPSIGSINGVASQNTSTLSTPAYVGNGFNLPEQAKIAFNFTSEPSTHATCAFWFKLTAEVTTRKFLMTRTRETGSDLVGLIIENNNLYWWSYNGPGALMESNLSTDTWYHIATKCSASGLSVVLNGVYKGGDGTALSCSNMAYFAVGAAFSGTGISCTVDDVMFYTRILNEQEILNLYNSY